MQVCLRVRRGPVLSFLRFRRIGFVPIACSELWTRVSQHSSDRISIDKQKSTSICHNFKKPLFDITHRLNEKELNLIGYSLEFKI